jgi:hypothetical protein
MVEFFLGADHPSVHSYIRNVDGSIGPSFLTPVDENDLRDVRFRQGAIVAYVDRYCAVSGLLKRRLVDRERFAIHKLREFLEKPSSEEARVFAAYQHTEQQVESDFVPMVKRLKIAEIVSRGATYRHGVWPEGSHALSRSLWLYRSRKWLSATKKQLLDKLR